MSHISATALWRSASFYPVTGLYVTSVTVVSLLARGAVTVLYAIMALSVAAGLAILFASYRELRQVHKMIDGQRSEMVAHIDELSAMLARRGVEPPPAGGKEQEAREDMQRGVDSI